MSHLAATGSRGPAGGRAQVQNNSRMTNRRCLLDVNRGPHGAPPTPMPEGASKLPEVWYGMVQPVTISTQDYLGFWVQWLPEGGGCPLRPQVKLRLQDVPKIPAIVNDARSAPPRARLRPLAASRVEVRRGRPNYNTT